jgi:phosphatidylglycerol:prolipoprotein diacylglycerol transferase
MLQEIFRIPYFNIPIYGYGVMLVIGFLGAIQLAKFLAKRNNIDPELFVNAGLLALVTGIAGARLSDVLENLHDFLNPNRSIHFAFHLGPFLQHTFVFGPVISNFLDAINIRSGGLTYYGGFLLAFPSLVMYAHWKKVPIRLGMDIVAPCLMIGLGFGRIGCFLNGCCQGAACDLPWAVTFPYNSIPYQQEVRDHDLNPPSELVVQAPDGWTAVLSPQYIREHAVDLPPDAAAVAASQHSLPLHPAQLYSSFTAFLIAGLVLCYFTLPHAPGRAFALMMMVEGLTRYLLELLRVEPPVIGTFSLSMILGLALLGFGIVLWFTFGFLDRDPDPAAWAAVPA